MPYKRIIALLLITFALVACGSSEPNAEPLPTLALLPTEEPVLLEVPCSTQAADFIAGVEAMAERWDDAVELASSTPRNALDGPVATLQELKREANSLEAPECAVGVKNSLGIFAYPLEMDHFKIFTRAGKVEKPCF